MAGGKTCHGFTAADHTAPLVCFKNVKTVGVKSNRTGRVIDKLIGVKAARIPTTPPASTSSFTLLQGHQSTAVTAPDGKQEAASS